MYVSYVLFCLRKQVTLRDTNHKPREIMYAKWSPTDSSLAIVDRYNIYYIPTVAKPNHVKQITFDGSKDFFNGIPDWVYKGNCLSYIINCIFIIIIVYGKNIKLKTNICF